MTVARIEEWLVENLARQLGIDADALDREAPFASYGLGSAQAVQLASDLTEWLGFSVSPTLAYDYTDVSQLARYLAIQIEGGAGDSTASHDGDAGLCPTSSDDPSAETNRTQLIADIRAIPKDQIEQELLKELEKIAPIKDDDDSQ